MGLLGNNIDRSLSALRSLQAARQTLEAAAIADAASIAELRGKLGEAHLAALLEGGDTRELHDDIRRLELANEGRELARPKLLERIRGAIRELGRHRAEVKRKAAGKLAERLAAHNAKVAELLTQLQDAAGCRYEQSVFAIVPGVIYMPGDLPLEGASNRAADGGGDSGATPGGRANRAGGQPGGPRR